MHALRRVGIQPGATVAVFGPGLLGLMSTANAKALGAGRVMVVGRGRRLALAKTMGADDLIDYEAADPVSTIRDLTGGLGVEYVFECAGNAAVIPQAVGAVARGGKIALLGLTGGATVPLSPDQLTLNEIDVLGVRSSPNAYPPMIKLIESGAVDLTPLLQHVYPMERVDDAFAALQSREAIRPIVEV